MKYNFLYIIKKYNFPRITRYQKGKFSPLLLIEKWRLIELNPLKITESQYAQAKDLSNLM